MPDALAWGKRFVRDERHFGHGRCLAAPDFMRDAYDTSLGHLLNRVLMSAATYDLQ
jgi:hypothetical protein